jgi:hypothetical protein
MTLEKYIARVKERMSQENTYIAEYKELMTLRYILLKSRMERAGIIYCITTVNELYDPGDGDIFWQSQTTYEQEEIYS